MKRPRDKSFLHDPRAPVFMAAFGVFFLWASYHTLESRKFTVGSVLLAVLMLWCAICSFVPLAVQLAVFAKKKRQASAAARAKGAVQ
jgi:predicted PurR-regulated permease PerM